MDLDLLSASSWIKRDQLHDALVHEAFVTTGHIRSKSTSAIA